MGLAQGAAELQGVDRSGICGPFDDQQNRGGDGSGKQTLLEVASYWSCLAVRHGEETNALDVVLLHYGNMSGVVVPGDVQMQVRERDCLEHLVNYFCTGNLDSTLQGWF